MEYIARVILIVGLLFCAIFPIGCQENNDEELSAMVVEKFLDGCLKTNDKYGQYIYPNEKLMSVISQWCESNSRSFSYERQAIIVSTSDVYQIETQEDMTNAYNYLMRIQGLRANIMITTVKTASGWRIYFASDEDV